jgi:putative methyltransferase (TIGR04325 family)
MGKSKDFFKIFLPPLVFSIFRFLRTKKSKSKEIETWSGDYGLWNDAKAKCTGYDSASILEQCKIALLKVKKGEAIYERDSVIFDKIQYSWGLLAGLQKAALENNGKLCVLDFGGSLGSSYFQNNVFLNSLVELQWCIIEQPHFVDCGKKYFESDQLYFFHTIEDCMVKFKPNVLLLSSVLQYLENPEDWIQKFVSLKIPYIIFDRTSVIEMNKNILTIQNVPEVIYKASYPCWFFDEKKLLKNFNGYISLASFDSVCDGATILNSKVHANWKGHILKVNS